MQRVSIRERENWRARLEELGLLYHSHDDGSPYWQEGACYRFSAAQIDFLDRAVTELQRLCIEAVGRIIAERRYQPFALPPFMIPVIEESWERDEVSIYGRFDLAWDGRGMPRLLEYNADTPTSLVEAAIAQWYWLQDTNPSGDQYNSLHERLVEAWKHWAPSLVEGPLCFLSQNTVEDNQTTAYLRDTAHQAGLPTVQMNLDDLGWDPARGCFVDIDERPVRAAFKLYPWEFMARDEFGQHLGHRPRPCHWLEPPWKMLLSNKAILPILWEWYPDCPYLLPTYQDGPRELATNGFVRKPLLGREGANVEICRPGQPVVASTPNPFYGAEGSVWQAIAHVPEFDGWTPVLGAWVVDGEPAGMGIRESRTPITDNRSCFVPHEIVD